MTVTTTITDGRPQQTAPPAGGRAAARRSRPEPSLLGRYLGYIGYFLGTGLLSGAIVHHPLDPARYTLIGALGAALFLVAAITAERQQPGRLTGLRVVAVLGTSLGLSFGIGMLSGGMQHFEDFPSRAAVLIPTGLLLSFVAYTLKEARHPLRKIFGPMGVAVLVLSVAGLLGLQKVAENLPAESGGHHHGAPAEGGDHEDAPAEGGHHGEGETAGGGHEDAAEGHGHEHEEAPEAPAAGHGALPTARPAPSASRAARATDPATPAGVPAHGSPGHHH